MSFKIININTINLKHILDVKKMFQNDEKWSLYVNMTNNGIAHVKLCEKL